MQSVILIGRPNVGKSALFNRIAGKRIAIIDGIEGTTRDVLSADVECFGKQFSLLDTGGVGISTIPFAAEVMESVKWAVGRADKLILVVDGSVGVTDLDRTMAKFALKSGKPVVLAVNKIDPCSNIEANWNGFGFRSLGIEIMFPVSAVHGTGVSDMLEAVIEEKIDDRSNSNNDIDGGAVKICIVGGVNAGKSTLVNKISGSRIIVSQIPGTTRDVVDTVSSHRGCKIVFKDTAGFRNQTRKDNMADLCSMMRTREAIKQSNLAVVVVDLDKGLVMKDRKILNLVNGCGVGTILFLNKCDLVGNEVAGKCIENIANMYPNLKKVPMIVGSAKSGHSVPRLLDEIIQMDERLAKQISTGKLNRWMSSITSAVTPRVIGGRPLKIYYVVQVGTFPPRFRLFVNDPLRLDRSYKQYILNKMKEDFGLHGIPVALHIGGKGKHMGENKG